MANFYVSSVAYTAVTPWGTSPFTASATVSLGQITRQSAPALNAERCFRVTTAGTLGTLEPTWATGSNATTNESGHGGTAVWTECTGQEAHQHDNGVTTTWTAPAARMNNINASGKNVLAAGDTMFLSSDHAETVGSGNLSINNSTGTIAAPITIISVNRTSTNLPPLAADVLAGATSNMTTNGSFTLSGENYYEGVSFVTSSTSGMVLQGSNLRLRIRNGSITLTGSGATLVGGANGGEVILENVTLVLNNANQHFNPIGSNACSWLWKNSGTAALSGTAPTNLFTFNSSGQDGTYFTLEGLDLSGMGGNTIFLSGVSAVPFVSMRNCKLGSSYVIDGSRGATTAGSVIEGINCDSANTNYNNFRSTGQGDLTTDISTTLVGGATDGVQAYSHKIVTQSIISIPHPFDSFAILHWNSITGTPVSLNIELISSASVNDNDVWIEAFYLADTADCLGAIVSTFPATPLTTASAIVTSSATWNNAPATPVKQVMTITFTPNKVGWVRGVVRVAKVSKTLWINPQFT